MPTSVNAMSKPNDSAREAVDEVNDAVNDGGGCVEAWESMNALRSKNDASNPDRRAAIKILGTGAMSVAGLGAAANRTSAKKPTGTSPEIDHVTGSEANKAVSTAIRTREFRNLRKKLHRDEGYSVKIPDASVLEVEDPDGNPHQIVAFQLEKRKRPRDSEDGVDVTADMSVTLQNGEVTRSRAVEFTSDTRNSGDGSIPVSAKTYKPVGSEIRSNRTEAVVEENPTEDEFSVAESGGCFACTVIGDAVCAVGCGLAISAACATTAVANLGAGVACGVIAGAFCTIITATRDRYAYAGCSGDFAIEAACYYAGYCSKPFAG